MTNSGENKKKNGDVSSLLESLMKRSPPCSQRTSWNCCISPPAKMATDQQENRKLTLTYSARIRHDSSANSFTVGLQSPGFSCRTKLLAHGALCLGAPSMALDSFVRCHGGSYHGMSKSCTAMLGPLKKAQHFSEKPS